MNDSVKIETPIAPIADNPTIWYDIDFNRVRDIGDVINILRGMQLSFGDKYLEKNPGLKAYVKLKEEKS